jgi:uncharacterized membrane protein
LDEVMEFRALFSRRASGYGKSLPPVLPAVGPGARVAGIFSLMVFFGELDLVWFGIKLAVESS